MAATEHAIVDADTDLLSGTVTLTCSCTGVAHGVGWDAALDAHAEHVDRSRILAERTRLLGELSRITVAGVSVVDYLQPRTDA